MVLKIFFLFEYLKSLGMEIAFVLTIYTDRIILKLCLLRIVLVF